MKKEQLIQLLEQTITALKENDSMEGRIMYQFGDEPGTFNVDAFVRVGNSQGQGGAIIVQGPMR